MAESMSLAEQRGVALRQVGVLKRNARTLVARQGRRFGLIPERRPDAYKAGQVGQVSRSAEDAVRAVSDKRSVAAYGDEAFAREMNASIPGCTWFSHRLADLAAGAVQMSPSALLNIDAIVVGGTDVKFSYSNLLHHARSLDTPPEIQWVGGGFEMSGSTLPVPASVDDAHIYLFHHFGELFGMRDPLVVDVSIRGESVNVSFQHLIVPGATAIWRLSELVPDRSEPIVVEVRAEHPKLSSGRHQRWRVWADLVSGQSIASLHGAHDFGPDHRAEAVLPSSTVGIGGRFELSIPNYDGVLPTDNVVKLGPETIERSAGSPVTVLRTLGPDRVSYQYEGHGTAFWFGFDAAGSLSANHEANVPTARTEWPVPSRSRSQLAAAYAAGFIPGMHLIPLCGKDQEIQFGASVDWSNPMPRSMRVCVFGPGGAVLSDETRTDLGPEIWAQELAASFPNADSVGIAPDYLGCDLDPHTWACLFNLVARHASGDRDSTEFQSSWRNLGVSVPGFPHWLHESKGVRGTTSVVGRWTNVDGWRTFLLAVNGSGNLSYDTTAALSVHVLDTAGSVVEIHDVVVRPFGSGWLEIGKAVPPGAGSLLVKSADADLTCQVVTTTQNRTVGLQHLWGY